MPKPAGEGRCVVCGREGRQAAKYRCPGCRERYCSVPCYKKHKEECTSKADPATRPAESEASYPIQRDKSRRTEGSPWSLDDILTEDDEGDRVPLQKLHLLKESEELQVILSNPHLHTLLLTIDQAKDKSILMRKYMQEPVFAEFADCCLRIVESEVEEAPGECLVELSRGFSSPGRQLANLEMLSLMYC